jgi:hypothetical protein
MRESGGIGRRTRLRMRIQGFCREAQECATFCKALLLSVSYPLLPSATARKETQGFRSRTAIRTATRRLARLGTKTPDLRSFAVGTGASMRPGHQPILVSKHERPGLLPAFAADMRKMAIKPATVRPFTLPL